jgi:serine/threonine protein kinase
MNWKEKLRSLLQRSAEQMTQMSGTTLASDAPTTLVASGSARVNAPMWQRRYKLLRELYKGGMGTVLLVERLSDSLLVCLKFLHADIDRRIVEQECRALMRLRHPSIVSLLDFSLEDEPPWMATEYVDGSTLRTYLNNHNPLASELMLPILISILKALDYAHGERVIHRDLKPENLMINAEGSSVCIRILDFGIAIVDNFDHAGSMTAENSPLSGTLLYMAPEQFEGRLLTPACDLYAVGLMAWEMSMGRSVFEGKTMTQIMLAKVTRIEGYALEGTSAPFPAKLSSIVEACTAREPAARPSAREALAMLQSL